MLYQPFHLFPAPFFEVSIPTPTKPLEPRLQVFLLGLLQAKHFKHCLPGFKLFLDLALVSLCLQMAYLGYLRIFFPTFISQFRCLPFAH